MFRRFYFFFLFILVFGAREGALRAQATPPDLKAAHLINRLTFGPSGGDFEKVKKAGLRAYLEKQLNPASLKDPPALTRQIESLKTLSMSPVQLFQTYGPPSEVELQNASEKREAVQEKRKEARVIVNEAAQAKLLRALMSPKQLQEVMVDFWFNHFNVFAEKGLDRLWVGSYEETAIRPHAMGKFRDLLGATAHHPAMMFYLDNWQSVAPGAFGGRGKQSGLNENYARELMELHTLGVDGGYTQKDVIELARIFTGWGFPPRRELKTPAASEKDTAGFFFNPRRHDYGEKVFLGHTFRGTGMDEGEKALDLLARSPATARHISFELAQYFVSDLPPPALVDRLSQTFTKTGGDIRKVLRVLFQSPEFWDPVNYGAKFKTPYHYAVSTVRALGVPVENVRPLMQIVREWGMPLYGCLTPDGYKNTEEAWLNADAMMKRLSFATALAKGRYSLSDGKQGTQDPGRVFSELKPFLSEQTQETLANSQEDLRLALMLGSPDFMKF